MKLVTLRPQDLPRYGLTVADPVSPCFSLGLEENGTPLALLMAVGRGDVWELPVLDCVGQWDEALLDRLLTALTIWAGSSGIRRITCRPALPPDQARGISRLLTRTGWSLGPENILFSLRMGCSPTQQPPQSPPAGLVPFFKLPLPARAQFFSGHQELADLGALESGLSIAHTQADRVEGCILTGRQARQYMAQAWLPQDRDLSVQMLCLLSVLCRRRQIHLLTLQTDQPHSADLVQELFSEGIAGIHVQRTAQWPKGE